MQVEDVVGVVFGLDRGQAVVVLAAVAGDDPLLPLVADEVEVGGAGRVGLDVGADVARPADRALVVDRVLPHRQRVDDPGGAARGHRRALVAARDRSSPGEDDVLGRRGDDDLPGPCAEGVDRSIRQLVQVLGRPVVAVAGRVVEHRLQRRVGHRRDHLPLGLAVEQRRHRLTRLGLWTGVGDEDHAGKLVLQVLGHELLGRAGQVEQPAADLIRRRGDEVAVGASQLGTLAWRPDQQCRAEVRQRVQAESQLRGDAEVAAAAVQRPEELGVLVLGGAHGAAVDGEQLDREQVVAGQAELALDPARTTAQGEAGDARRRDAPAGGGEAVGLASRVEVAPGGTTLHGGRASRRIDRDGVHPAQVDRQAAVGEASAGDAVATAADRDLEAALEHESKGRRHVLGIPALGDRGRALGDHRVEDRTGLLVTAVAVGEDLTAEALAEAAQGGGVGGCGGHRGSFRRNDVSRTTLLALSRGGKRRVSRRWRRSRRPAGRSTWSR